MRLAKSSSRSYKHESQSFKANCSLISNDERRRNNKHFDEERTDCMRGADQIRQGPAVVEDGASANIEGSKTKSRACTHRS